MTPFIIAHGIGACCGPGTWDIAWQVAGNLGIAILIVAAARGVIEIFREVSRG